MRADPLVIERMINAPAARVWQALTDIDELKRWSSFFPDFKAEVGFKTTFLLGPDDEHQYKHLVEVTAVEPGKLLRHSWCYEGYQGYSDVTFELTPVGDQTQLKLTHRITSPFPDEEAFAAKNFEMGWNYTADALKQYVEAKEQ